MVKGHDAMLAVDVGGTNIRAGIVELNLGKAENLSKARMFDIGAWRHTGMRISSTGMTPLNA
jgi:hexokinase